MTPTLIASRTAAPEGGVNAFGRPGGTDMTVHRFDRATLAATPWKNGGGVTREIVCQPPGAGMDAFDWRVSIAHIGSDGPFSTFAGVDRVITLLEGAGVRLLGTDGAFDHRLDTPLRPFAFDGEAPVLGTLLDGDCHDFNVMTRRAACRATVAVCRGATTLAAPAGLLMAVSGHWRAGDQMLAPGEGLWWNHGAQSWALSCEQTAAALLAVSIQAVNP
ncbi:HutD/Ves family protein [Hydrogenophaga sp. OTU3427]|uniref:HutD/Ves family protein n=1 Tax=Hydrogenophaga sp. OTU3427 TaxID=3043856 RepID=UPI00406CE058